MVDLTSKYPKADIPEEPLKVRTHSQLFFPFTSTSGGPDARGVQGSKETSPSASPCSIPRRAKTRRGES
ncbi:Quinic acid utilization activator [Fusarium oxysporum f. sp. albedinis]|nr:Quinic acid utilization activator [Fusarium oxysporum f. sp. albedinis]